PRVSLRRLALVALVVACGRVPHDDALARLRARGTLRWGGDVQGGEPYVFQDPRGGGLVGFEVEIADALARRLGVRAEFVQNGRAALLPGAGARRLPHPQKRPRGAPGGARRGGVPAPLLPLPGDPRSPPRRRLRCRPRGPARAPGRDARGLARPRSPPRRTG